MVAFFVPHALHATIYRNRSGRDFSGFVQRIRLPIKSRAPVRFAEKVNTVRGISFPHRLHIFLSTLRANNIRHARVCGGASLEEEPVDREHN
jgi:hypothetical protein